MRLYTVPRKPIHSKTSAAWLLLTPEWQYTAIGAVVSRANASIKSTNPISYMSQLTALSKCPTVYSAGVRTSIIGIEGLEMIFVNSSKVMFCIRIIDHDSVEVRLVNATLNARSYWGKKWCQSALSAVLRAPSIASTLCSAVSSE